MAPAVRVAALSTTRGFFYFFFAAVPPPVPLDGGPISPRTALFFFSSFLFRHSRVAHVVWRAVHEELGRCRPRSRPGKSTGAVVKVLT